MRPHGRHTFAHIATLFPRRTVGGPALRYYDTSHSTPPGLARCLEQWVQFPPLGRYRRPPPGLLLSLPVRLLLLLSPLLLLSIPVSVLALAVATLFGLFQSLRRDHRRHRCFFLPGPFYQKSVSKV